MHIFCWSGWSFWREVFYVSNSVLNDRTHSSAHACTNDRTLRIFFIFVKSLLWIAAINHKKKPEHFFSSVRSSNGQAVGGVYHTQGDDPSKAWSWKLTPWEFQKHPPKCEVFSEVSPDEECEKPTIARHPNEIKGDQRGHLERISDNSETWSIYLMKMGDREIHLAIWWSLKESPKVGWIFVYKSVFAYSTSKDVETQRNNFRSRLPQFLNGCIKMVGFCRTEKQNKTAVIGKKLEG